MENEQENVSHTYHQFAAHWLRAQQLVGEWAKRKGWWDKPREDGTAYALMHSELSESLEALRTDAGSDKISGYTGEEEELADVVIRIMEYSARKGLRVGQAFIEKMSYNEGRPYRHGKKF